MEMSNWVSCDQGCTCVLYCSLCVVRVCVCVCVVHVCVGGV